MARKQQSSRDFDDPPRKRAKTAGEVSNTQGATSISAVKLSKSLAKPTPSSAHRQPDAIGFLKERFESDEKPNPSSSVKKTKDPYRYRVMSGTPWPCEPESGRIKLLFPIPRQREIDRMTATKLLHHFEKGGAQAWREELFRQFNIKNIYSLDARAMKASSAVLRDRVLDKRKHIFHCTDAREGDDVDQYEYPQLFEEPQHDPEDEAQQSVDNTRGGLRTSQRSIKRSFKPVADEQSDHDHLADVSTKPAQIQKERLKEVEELMARHITAHNLVKDWTTAHPQPLQRSRGWQRSGNAGLRHELNLRDMKLVKTNGRNELPDLSELRRPDTGLQADDEAMRMSFALFEHEGESAAKRFGVGFWERIRALAAEKVEPSVMAGCNEERRMREVRRVAHAEPMVAHDGKSQHMSSVAERLANELQESEESEAE
ncbi:MAG: hypothetical protein Q9159_005584 [Coniocarpon cinnabarinum]